MAVFNGYEVGMQVLYTPEDYEFIDAVWGGTSYPTIITKIEFRENNSVAYHLTVFTDHGMFIKRDAQPTDFNPGANPAQRGRFSMTSNQYDKEVAAQTFGLNYRLFRP